MTLRARLDVLRGYNRFMKSATIGVRELRDGLSRHLADVRAGGEITVTDHGKPIARIVPVGESRLERLIADGRVDPPSRPAAELPRRQRGASLSDLIER